MSSSSTPSPQQLIRTLGANPDQGLSPEEVARSRRLYGSNILGEVRPTSRLTLIRECVQEPMMVLLLAIAVLSLVFGKPTEAIVMLFVVIAYVVVEFINTSRADRTMARLRALTQPTTRVLRSGAITDIPTADVVVGDVVILSEGSRPPADLGLIDAFGLLVNEASLTGESFPVPKKADATVFAGTLVLSGEGKGVVSAVGETTQLGVLAATLHTQVREKTAIQQAMGQLTKILAIFAIVGSLLIPLVGFLRGLPGHEMILTWLALTFLMVPGQPPIIITMALALAAFEISGKKILVKRLRGVEALGQVSAIVTDKTGTLTENRMYVHGFVTESDDDLPPEKLPEVLRHKMALCVPHFSKDPTDVALGVAVRASEARRAYASLQGRDGHRPWRELVYRDGPTEVRAIAGEPEQIVAHSRLSLIAKERLQQQLLDAARKGFRVVACAWQEGTIPWEFLALVLLSDPVRPGARQAIRDLDRAHVSTYMVTGDHPATARRIAEEIGLGLSILTGEEMDHMGDEKLRHQLEHVHVCARVRPEQKMQIVHLLEHGGVSVAAIGDGVNDAPAIKAASVGIAMGEVSTDVAREAADLIITDDSYVHLPGAIASGRKALDNFRKGLTYYLSSKSVLLITFLVPLVFAVPFPFAPLHILLIELIMDLASSTIFVTEEAEPYAMEQPAPKIESFLSWKMAKTVAQRGIFSAIGILVVYLGIFASTGDLVLARTAALVTWFIAHILLALNIKQDYLPLSVQGITTNRFGITWLAGMLALSLAITTIPALHHLFQTTSLPPGLWLLVIVVAIASTCWIEVIKRMHYIGESRERM